MFLAKISMNFKKILRESKNWDIRMRFFLLKSFSWERPPNGWADAERPGCIPTQSVGTRNVERV